jgi:drug/metabolite transporter (DMT)-like permease
VKSGREPTPATKHDENVVLGMAAALAAFFMFTLMNAFAKALSDNHSVVEIAFYRNLIATAFFLVLIFGFGRRDILVLHSKPMLVGIRAVIGSLSLMATFWAYALMPMADTTVLMFTSSLFIPVLGIIFLKESVGPWRWAAVVIGFAGVAVMVQPSGNVSGLGIAVALGATMLHATLQIILRYLGRYESPETISFYFFLIGTVVTALPLPFIAVQPELNDVPLLIGVGLSGAAAQWLLSTAFRHAKASIVTVFNYSSLVWATVLGWLIWNEWPLPAVIIGGIIVIASNLLMIWREARVRRITGERLRAKL